MPKVTIEEKVPVGNGVSKINKQEFEVPNTIDWFGTIMHFDKYSAGYYDAHDNFLSVFDFVAYALGEKVEDAPEK